MTAPNGDFQVGSLGAWDETPNLIHKKVGLYGPKEICARVRLPHLLSLCATRTG